MSKQSIGILSIILGALFLGLELFLLPLIQAAKASLHNGFYANALSYLFEMPCILGLLLTLSVIVYGIFIVVEHKENRTIGNGHD